MRIHYCILSAAVLLCAGCSNDTSSTAPVNDDRPAATAETATAHATRVFWGDTHLHTGNSGDAFALGNRLGPEDALRFARGEAVTSATGQLAQLDRPLDFLVIADHAEGLGTTLETYRGNPVLIADPTLARWAEMFRQGGAPALAATREMIRSLADGTLPPVISDPEQITPIIRSVWEAQGEAVERQNEPGTFTAFVGYEYTSVPKGDNLHRVVVFRDGTERTNQILPFSALQSDNPEDLWSFLEAYERDTGGRALAIPHNSNLSNGRMFAMTDFEGSAMDAAHARRRARWEPIVEATQIKGDSESHPFMSPNDEFAAFGDRAWELGNLSLQTATTDAMLPGSYVREALKRGLAVERTTGVNPFKVGMIGSTDSHTALATADDTNFWGKNTQMEPSADRTTGVHKKGSGIEILGWHYLAGGYAAVWAQENTRASLFDAMLRKEVYATTGPRMTVRMFGGWNFSEEDVNARDMPARGYAGGVPMGGDLPSVERGETPVFLVAAQKDPEGANLDRIQIVKGWIDASGELHERVYDVVWSDADLRPRDSSGRVPEVASSVDLVTASYRNDTGATELRTSWHDPDFDASQSAFYYARILEIPTPTWVARDAVRYGLELPADANLVHQERGYTSPIWYTP